MNWFKDAIEKSPANDKDQSAKTRSFLEVSFPLKTVLAFTNTRSHGFSPTQAVHETWVDAETKSNDNLAKLTEY